MRARGACACACAVLCALLCALASSAGDCHLQCNLHIRGPQTPQLPGSKCKCANKHKRRQATPLRPLIRIHELSTTVRSVPLLPARSFDSAPVFYEPADYYQYLSPLYQNDFNQHLYIISPVITHKPGLSQRKTSESAQHNIAFENVKLKKDNNNDDNAFVPKTRFKNDVDLHTNQASADFLKSMEISSLYLDIGLDNAEARSRVDPEENTKLYNMSNTENSLLMCIDHELLLVQRKTNSPELISTEGLNTSKFQSLQNLSEADLLKEIKDKCNEVQSILKESAKDIQESRMNKKDKSFLKSFPTTHSEDDIIHTTTVTTNAFDESRMQHETNTEENAKEKETSSSIKNTQWESSVPRPPYDSSLKRAGVAYYIEDSTDSEVSDSLDRTHIFDHVEHDLKSHENVQIKLEDESNNRSKQLENITIEDLKINTSGTTESLMHREIVTSTTPVTVELSEPTATNDNLTDTITPSDESIIYKTTQNFESVPVSQSLLYQPVQTKYTQLPSTMYSSPSYTNILDDTSESIKYGLPSSTLGDQYGNETTKPPDTTIEVSKSSFKSRGNTEYFAHSPSTTNPTDITTVSKDLESYGKESDFGKITTQAIDNVDLVRIVENYNFSLPTERINSYKTTSAETMSTTSLTPTEHTILETTLANQPKRELSTLSMSNTRAIQEQHPDLSTSSTEPTTETTPATEDRPKLKEAHIQIPKLETIELKNGSILSTAKGFELLPNQDFVTLADCSSRREIKESISNKKIDKEANVTSRTNFNQPYHLLTGKIMFVRDNQQIPLRFLQNVNGNVDLGIDGNYLCNSLLKNHNVSIILSALCNYTNSKPNDETETQNYK